jgi:hypothetical protein
MPPFMEEASRRAVPLQAIALERQPPSRHPLLFLSERGGYLDLHNPGR